MVDFLQRLKSLDSWAAYAALVVDVSSGRYCGVPPRPETARPAARMLYPALGDRLVLAVPQRHHPQYRTGVTTFGTSSRERLDPRLKPWVAPPPLVTTDGSRLMGHD